jgi:hypothetical protein
VLAVPEGKTSDQDVKSCIMQILDRQKVWELPWVKVGTSYKFLTKLDARRRELASFLSRSKFLDHQTISRSLQPLHNRLFASFIENTLLIDEVIAIRCEMEPPVSAEFSGEMEHLALIAGLVSSYCEMDNCALMFTQKNQTMTITAEIARIDHARDEFEVLPLPIALVKVPIPVWSSLVDALKFADYDSLIPFFRAAISKWELTKAIKLAWLRYRVDVGSYIDDQYRRNFSIGNDFLQSLKTFLKNDQDARKIIRGMVEVLDNPRILDAGSHDDHLGHTYYSESKRGMTARRKHLVGKKLRIFYWQHGDEDLELSLVSQEYEPSMPSSIHKSGHGD